MESCYDFCEEDILQWCQDPHRRIIGGSTGGTQVIRVGHQFAVKFGDVFPEEADNQRKAYDLLDKKVVRVPRVYCFFARKGVGYLLMEYIEGSRDDGIDDSDRADIVAKVVDYLGTLQGTHPGPFAGGASRGLLWPEAEDITFDTVDYLESYLNSRLIDCQDKLNLVETSLVACHLDVAPRNILWLEDGSICLLDWASAGYYPRFFEFCALRVNTGDNGRDLRFTQQLMKAMKPLTKMEVHQQDLVLRARFNNIRYHL